MSARLGFTLVELLTVLIIIGVLAAVALPNFMHSMEQTKAQSAQNNLSAISAAQQKHYEDYSAYFPNNPVCALAPTAANTSYLFGGLGMSVAYNDPFNYCCRTLFPPGPGEELICSASDSKVTLQLVETSRGSTITCTTGGAYCPPT